MTIRQAIRPTTIRGASHIGTALVLLWASLAAAQTNLPMPARTPTSASLPASASAPTSTTTSTDTNAISTSVTTPTTTSTDTKKPTSTSAPISPTSQAISPEILPYVPLVDAKISPQVVALGGVLTYTLIIEHKKEVSVTVPDSLPFGSGVRLRKALPPRTEALPDGGERETYDFEVQIFALGEVQIPAMNLFFRAPTGAARVAGPAVSLNIPKTLPPEEDINDKFTPREIQPAEAWWLTWLKSYGPYLGAGLLLAFGGLFFYLRAKKKQAPPAPMVKEAPFLVANKKLDQLEREKPAAKEFHLRLSETLRGYLEDGLGLPAREATSAELLTRLRREVPPKSEKIDRKKLEGFLLENDFVKFAKDTPPLPDLLRSLGFVREVVDATKPAPDEAKPAKGDDQTSLPTSRTGGASAIEGASRTGTNPADNKPNPEASR